MALGYSLGIGLSYAVADLGVRLFPEMLMLIRPEELVRQLPVMIFMTGLAALMPLGRVLRVDPMIVFRD